MENKLSEHSASVGETYIEHLRYASAFGWQMLMGGFACFIHALLPFLLASKGSETIRLLKEKLDQDRLS